MDHWKRNTRQGSAMLGVLLLLPLVVTLGAKSFDAVAQAATNAPPACSASQIVVSAGPTKFNSPYPVRTSTGIYWPKAYEAIPVYFHNTGSKCHLLMEGPDVRPVRNTTNPTNVPLSDVAIPTSVGSTNRLLVGRHKELEALFVVIKPTGALRKMYAGCDPTTTTGLLIGDYANPIATTHFITRPVRNVDFSSSPRCTQLNYGIGWPPKQ